MIREGAPPARQPATQLHSRTNKYTHMMFFHHSCLFRQPYLHATALTHPENRANARVPSAYIYMPTIQPTKLCIIII